MSTEHQAGSDDAKLAHLDSEIRHAIGELQGMLRQRRHVRNKVEELSSKSASALNHERERGLYDKFIVLRSDGADNSGEKHEACQYVVLDTTHDVNTRAAVLAYSFAVFRDGYHPLASGLANLVATSKLRDEEAMEILRVLEGAYNGILGTLAQRRLLVEVDRNEMRGTSERWSQPFVTAIVSRPIRPVLGE